MVGLGFFFVALTLVASVLHWRGLLFESRWLLWIFVFAVTGAVAANQLGWVAAEVGRQPWIVQPPMVRGADGALVLDSEGHVQYATATVTLEDGTTGERVAGLRTSDGVSEVVTSGQVLGSMVMFGLLYGLLLLLWLYVLNAKIQAGPHGGEHAHAARGTKDLPGAMGSRVGHAESLTGGRE